MKRHTIAAGWLASFVAASCMESAPTGPVDDAWPAFLISDAAHDVSVTGFYFLPPLVRAPSTVGMFDAARLPRVEICALSGTGEEPPNEGTPKDGATEISSVETEVPAEEPPTEEEPPAGGDGDKEEEPPVEEFPVGCGTLAIASFAMDAGEIEVGVDHYGVEWHTSDYTLDPALTYRIYVIEGSVERGFADLDVVDSGRELKSVDTGEYIPLLDGRTLPIQFRLEMDP